MNPNSILFITAVLFVPLVQLKHTEEILRQNQFMKDSKHGIKMGEVFPGCDDAQVCSIFLFWIN